MDHTKIKKLILDSFIGGVPKYLEVKTEGGGFFIFAPLADQLPWTLCLVCPLGKIDNADDKFWKLPGNITIEFLRYFETIDFVEAFRIC